MQCQHILIKDQLWTGQVLRIKLSGQWPWPTTPKQHRAVFMICARHDETGKRWLSRISHFLPHSHYILALKHWSFCWPIIETVLGMFGVVTWSSSQPRSDCSISLGCDSQHQSGMWLAASVWDVTAASVWDVTAASVWDVTRQMSALHCLAPWYALQYKLLQSTALVAVQVSRVLQQTVCTGLWLLQNDMDIQLQLGISRNI